MSKATFPETTGQESLKPQDGGTRIASDMRNALSALFQGDHSPLRPRSQAAPNMTVAVSSALINSYFSQVWLGTTAPLNYAGGNSSAVTAPTTNPRIDLLTIDASGTLAWTVGAEAASPSAPNCPSGKVPICYVYCKTTMTKIVNFEDKDANPNDGYIYKDIRPLLHLKNDNAVKNDGSVNPINLLSNGDFEDWSAGTSVAPDGWTLSAEGGETVARDDWAKPGNWSAVVYRNGNNCYLTQSIHLTKGTTYGLAYFKGRKVTFSAWVYATVASRGRIGIYDGISVSYSSYHTGDSTWQLLTVTKTIDSSATSVGVGCYVDTGDATVYFDGAILVEGESVFAFADRPVLYSDRRYKVVLFSWQINTTGTQEITGVGFAPKSIKFLASVEPLADAGSWGFDDLTTNWAMYDATATGAADDSKAMASVAAYIPTGSGIGGYFDVTATGSDGFTITKGKNGSPPSYTATVIALCER